LPRTLLALLALVFGTQAFAARTTTYLHNDGLGSVVAATNEAGQVLWRKDYAPFGQQIDPTPDTERLSYTGKSHDADLGLTYFGARYFDPEIGRFMSPDPVGFVEDNPMSFNRYLYVNNNPYKYVDPDGEFLNFAVKFVLDVGINVAFNYVTTGKLNVGGALKESAIGVINPAKTLAKAKKLSAAISKMDNAAPCRLSCFVAGTTVLTERGYAPIETLEVGDRVWAHDPDTGETALKPILHTFVNTKDSVWQLILEKEGLRYLHEVTGSHPYFVLDGEGRGLWVEVAQLKEGALIKTHTGEPVRVIALHDTGAVLTTYNFEVADINTYYVSSANVLVHNCGQTVGDLRAAGMRDAHHVIQDAAVRDLPRYNTNAAPGIQLVGPSNVAGTPHNMATAVQRQAGGGTYAAERRIGYKAMRKAGVSQSDARAAIQQADDYFGSIGVGPDTVTRIPGNR
jgi:RHS repeat-associated protein